MFFYNADKDQILEVSIVETYSVSDFKRLLLFIDALTAKSSLKVSFKIHPSVKKEFLTCLEIAVATPTYQFTIS